MTLPVKKLPAALLAIIVAIAMTFTMGFSIQPAYADDEEEYSAIEIQCTGDEYAPLYSDGTKSFKFALVDPSQWGKEGTDWELKYYAEAVDSFGSWENIPLSKDDGDFTYTAKTRTIKLNGKNIFAKVKAVHDYADFEVYICATIETLDGTLLAGDDTLCGAAEAYIDYDFERDRDVLPDTGGIISHIGYGMIANAKHPYGSSFKYTVTKVVSSDPEIVEISKNGKDWGYYAMDVGTAVITVTYIDINKKTRTYIFEINVKTDIYETTIKTPNGLAALPGGSIQVYAETIHSTPDGTEVLDVLDLPDNLHFAYSLDPGDEQYANLSTGPFPGFASISFYEETGDWQVVGVNVSLYDNSGERLCSDSVALHCTYKYSVLDPQVIDELEDLAIGDSITITPEIWLYSIDYPDGLHVENIPYEWVYDEKTVKIECVDPTAAYPQYKITRLSGDADSIVLYADWVDFEDEPQYDVAMYDLPYVSDTLEDYDVHINGETGYLWPVVAVSDLDDSVSLSDLDISVQYDGQVLPTDKYTLKTYRYYPATDKMEPVEEPFKVTDLDAGNDKIAIVAEAVNDSGYTGATGEFSGFTLSYKYSLNHQNATVDFGDAYEDCLAIGTRNWHPYYQLPSDNPPSELRVTNSAGDVLQLTDEYNYTVFMRDAEYSEVDPVSENVLPTDFGKYFAKVEGTGSYSGVTYVDFDLGKDNPVTFKAKTKTVKAKKLKKKAMKVNAITVKDAQGTLSFEKISGNKKSMKALKVNKKTGAITVKKKTKKGTYSIEVLVTDSGTDEYFETSEYVTVKIKVK